MLRRKITDTLIEWKNRKEKNCLLVEGARQVGKTYSIEDFAKKNYGNYIYLNFEIQQFLKAAFKDDLTVDAITLKLSDRLNVKFVPGDTLIFMDEIQACPPARTSLKSFTMDGRYDVIASGSLLGLCRRGDISYPVGYETRIEMYSLDFEEFLWANGVREGLITQVKESIRDMKSLDESTMWIINDLYEKYLSVGGMPKAVSRFVDTKDMSEVRAAKDAVLHGYYSDAVRYATPLDAGRIHSCFKSIPMQLSKDNKKFRYSDILEGKDDNAGKKDSGSARTYGGSLHWLFDAGIVSYCYNLTDLEIPLMENVRMNVFKLYMRDTGLLVSMMESGADVRLVGGGPGVNRGAVTENFVADMLVKSGYDLFYFARGSGLELDFVINLGGEVAVLEVKSGNDRQSKSLMTAKNLYMASRCIKLGNSNIGVDSEGVENYPIFAIAFAGSMVQSDRGKPINPESGKKP